MNAADVLCDKNASRFDDRPAGQGEGVPALLISEDKQDVGLALIVFAL